MTGTVIIGVGNIFRCDDGVGIHVVRRVRDTLGPEGESIGLFECDGDPSVLLESWHGAGLAVVVDASEPSGKPGRIHWTHSTEGLLKEAHLRTSSHTLGIVDALGLATAIGITPREIQIVAVEGREFGFGEQMTPEVEAAAGQVAEELVRRVRAGRC